MEEENRERQQNELLVLESIYGERHFVSSPQGEGGRLLIHVELPTNFKITYPTNISASSTSDASTHEEVRVEYLPPVVLQFTFTDKYPSEEPPFFTLQCLWMNASQIGALTDKLSAIWLEEGPEMEILYTWTQYIIEHALSFADMRGDSSMLLNDDKEVACASSTADKSMEDVLNSIIEYDSQESRYQFTTHFYTCGVCFVEKSGTESFKFPQCRHVYCLQCMDHYFTMQITEGAVRSLTCPDPECDAETGPHVVKTLVKEEVYAKYEKFLLESTLAGMRDVVYCPRSSCQTAVLIDQDVGNLGRCAACNFVFCVLCKLTFHGQGACPGTELVVPKRKTTEIQPDGAKSTTNEDLGEMEDFFINVFESDTYVNGTVQKRNEMERKYGKGEKSLSNTINPSKTLQNFASEITIDLVTTPCPKCRCPIEKNQGCNHMHCTVCGCDFCYACGGHWSGAHYSCT